MLGGLFPGGLGASLTAARLPPSPRSARFMPLSVCYDSVHMSDARASAVTSPQGQTIPASSAETGALRCVSVDVEEYFHIEAAYGVIGSARWSQWPSRIEHGVEKVLDLFARCNQRGTFFVLGEVARRSPRAVQRIAEAGHEIASHGTGHDRLHRLTPESLRQDVADSRSRLEDVTGEKVIGYRSPSWSLTHQTAWAVDVLAELGLEYDASVFPIRRRGYGIADAPIEPFLIQGRPEGPTLLEVPALVWRVAGRNVPVAGGGYFRMLPLWLMRRGLRQAARRGRPAVLYFHPWEFDPDQPRMPLSWKNRLRTYIGLRRAEARLESIMQQPAAWTPIRDMLQPLHACAARRPPFCLGQGG